MENYEIKHVNTVFVLIVDLDNGRTITNDAENVVRDLDIRIQGGLGCRKIFYLDTAGRFDQLEHDHGFFTGFAACSDRQQQFLSDLLSVYHS